MEMTMLEEIKATERLLGVVNDTPDAEVKAIVFQIARALWPNGNPDHEWSPDTLETIAACMGRFHPNARFGFVREAPCPECDKVHGLCVDCQEIERAWRVRHGLK